MSDGDPDASKLQDEEPSVFDEIDAEAEEAALQRAEAQAVAGKVVPHEEVAAWLRTWGTPDERPAPPRWFE